MNQAGPVFHIHLFKYVSQMVLDSSLTDKKTVRNVGIFIPFEDIRHDFGFPVREMVVSFERLIIDFRMRGEALHGDKEKGMVGIGQSVIHNAAAEPASPMGGKPDGPFLYGEGFNTNLLPVLETLFYRFAIH